MSIVIKTPAEIDDMREACRLASEVLDMLTPLIKPGVSTEELDKIALRSIEDVQGATSATVGYQTPGYPPFPASLCTSVNHVVCHGIPSPKKILKNGDIINIDITVIHEGYHGDTSQMFLIGDCSVLARKICKVSQECLYRGIAQVRPGAHLGDIGHAIQTYAEAQNFSVVRDYCGHGIGLVFHEDPQVLHYGKPNTGMRLEPNMIFTIEPMINAGTFHTRVLPDQWTVVTRDHQLSAQWEHTILVTDTGYEVLTPRADEDLEQIKAHIPTS